MEKTRKMNSKTMRHNILLSITAAAAAIFSLAGCSDRPSDFVFRDYFVSVSSESGEAASTVLSTADNLVLQYPVRLVSQEREEDLEVTFEVVPGDGVKEGVDYSLPAKRTLTFSNKEYQKFIRINFLRHQVDESKDNTLTIRLTATSDPGVSIGYPGPSKKFSTHVITIVNN